MNFRPNLPQKQKEKRPNNAVQSCRRGLPEPCEVRKCHKTGRGQPVEENENPRCLPVETSDRWGTRARGITTRGTRGSSNDGKQTKGGKNEEPQAGDRDRVRQESSIGGTAAPCFVSVNAGVRALGCRRLAGSLSDLATYTAREPGRGRRKEVCASRRDKIGDETGAERKGQHSSVEARTGPAFVVHYSTGDTKLRFTATDLLGTLWRQAAACRRARIGRGGRTRRELQGRDVQRYVGEEGGQSNSWGSECSPVIFPLCTSARRLHFVRQARSHHRCSSE